MQRRRDHAQIVRRPDVAYIADRLRGQFTRRCRHRQHRQKPFCNVYWLFRWVFFDLPRSDQSQLQERADRVRPVAQTVFKSEIINCR